MPGSVQISQARQGRLLGDLPLVRVLVEDHPLVAFFVTINTIVTYGQTRFRAPAEPALALLAATGAVALVRSRRGPRSEESAAQTVTAS